MSRLVAASRFDSLRPWDGSQSRAFEELCYQLLKSEVPSGSEAIRTGNPDGGVEWYATLKDGSEQGWQAKHIRNFDSLLSAMTATVERVVRDRPRLAKLTFVISSNLSAGTRGGRARSQRQRYDQKVERWKATITGAESIEFDLIQESDLLDRLADSKHRGREWFWWGAPVLADGWLRDRLSEQSDAAGERYRPDLQVDLPIEEDLKALGFGESAKEAFERFCRRVVSGGREIRVTPSGPTELAKLHRVLAASVKSLVDAASSTTLTAASKDSALQPLVSALRKFLDAAQAAEEVELQLRAAWRELPPEEPERASKEPPSQALDYRVRELQSVTTELVGWLESSEGEALQKRLYFLLGPAGSGKTHLFLDAARRAIEETRPAVVLFGSRFGRGNLWESVCDQLGLDPVGADVLLGAMDAAGEASGLTGRRFVILVDAINETVSLDFWRTHLPAIRSAVARWPHVALAVSCRDTYLDVVDDGQERDKYVRRTHPGFVGREVEATHKYFAHFGLEAPRIPLLVPEFTLPLFLRMYCESLRESGETSAAVGHEGRVRIFERYLSAKLQQVARRLDPNAGSAYESRRAYTRAERVLDTLLDELASVGREQMPILRAEALATEALGGSAGDAGVVLGALQNEGVLTRELLYLDEGSTGEGLRIVFQAFADFLLLRRRLKSSLDPINDPDFKKWLDRDASWGIVEAASVVLPELYGVELPDFLALTKRSLIRPQGGDDEAWRHHNRARFVFQSTIETLPHRDASAITDRTVNVLNEGLSVVSVVELFRTFFQIAPQPSNPLNGDRLHRYLLQYNMPRRDAYFGIAMYQEIWDESGPTATLARWAAAGPYPDYDPMVVELACIPLVWLLSTPNRFMRDWVTKALVQLLRGHLDVMLRLLNRFWSVDDPYVVQRVVVIAYGALMRCGVDSSSDAKKLSARIRKLVFTRPVRADELLLDAARGIVEYGVHNQLLPKSAMRDIKRPYGIERPSNPPSQATLEKKYGYKENQPDDESYSSIYFSLTNMGDFGRYVVEAGVDYFSRYGFDQEYPDKEPWPAPRLVKSRWKVFVTSLTIAQQELLERIESSDDKLSDRLSSLMTEFKSTLTPKQQRLLNNCWSHPRRKIRIDEYPADRAQRWLFRRTLGLGWTPKLFGREDRVLGHGRGREGHKAERWGKKYQWMAYHELLARVADNFRPRDRFDGAAEYEGLYQLIADREIDPSLPPIAYRALAERSGEGAYTWAPSPVTIPLWPPGRIDFSRYHTSIERFLDDRDSEPILDRVAVVSDSEGNRWVLLDALISQGDPEADKSWLGLQQGFALDSWFVSREQAVDVMVELAALRKRDHWTLVDTHGHIDCCYFGELGWTPHGCYHVHRDLKQLDVDGWNWGLAPTVETYTWEGSLVDCSIGDTVSASAPSTFVQSRTSLLRDDAGPSWRDESGTLVLTTVRSDRERVSAFIGRMDWLQRFLAEHDLELMVASWHERRYLDGNHRRHYPSEDVYAAARIDSQAVIHLSDSLRERR